MELKKTFYKILRFFNLVDRGENLSITNIAVIVLITKMAIAPFDWPTAAALFMAVLNYAHKRTESAKAAKAEEASTQSSDVEAKILELASQVQGFALVQEAVAKQSEETKKLLSNSALAQAFAPKRGG